MNKVFESINSLVVGEQSFGWHEAGLGLAYGWFEAGGGELPMSLLKVCLR